MNARRSQEAPKADSPAELAAIDEWSLAKATEVMNRSYPGGFAQLKAAIQVALIEACKSSIQARPVEAEAWQQLVSLAKAEFVFPDMDFDGSPDIPAWAVLVNMIATPPTVQAQEAPAVPAGFECDAERLDDLEEIIHQSLSVKIYGSKTKGGFAIERWGDERESTNYRSLRAAIDAARHPSGTEGEQA